MVGEALHAFHKTGVDLGGASVIDDGRVRIEASNHYVPVGDRLVPDYLDGTFYGDASFPSVSFRVEVNDGAPRVVRLAFEGVDIRQTALREVQVDAILQLLAGFAVQVREGAAGATVATAGLGFVSNPGALDEAVGAFQAARGKRWITQALLRQVADVYREHIDRAPTQAVMDRFTVGRRQAGNYIRAARDAGYLPQTEPGRKRA